MAQVMIPEGRRFECAPTQTLLSAAVSAGVVIDHSCRTGRCGSCRARVLDGSTRLLGSEPGLSDDERNEGWVLTCMRGAASDLSLDLHDLGSGAASKPRIWPCRIETLQALAENVQHVVLRLPSGAPTQGLSWLSGQYVDVIGPQGVRRSYSVASTAAADSTRMHLHVRRVDGGAMSRYWFVQARPGDLLRLEGPLGTFFLRDVAGLHVALLATGTGIAPMLALLDDVEALEPARRPASLHLFWGGRRPADLYLDRVLAERAARWPLLSYVPVLSAADAHWSGVRGHVQQAWRAAAAAGGIDAAASRVYACGNDAMVRDARRLLTAQGLPPRRFHADAFVCSNRSMAAAPAGETSR